MHLLLRLSHFSSQGSTRHNVEIVRSSQCQAGEKLSQRNKTQQMCIKIVEKLQWVFWVHISESRWAFVLKRERRWKTFIAWDLGQSCVFQQCFFLHGSVPHTVITISWMGHDTNRVGRSSLTRSITYSRSTLISKLQSEFQKQNP